MAFFGGPMIISLMASSAAAVSSRGSVRLGSSSGAQVEANVYGEKYREEIIKSVISRATPSLFGWFDICPLNEASKVLNIRKHNDAYRLLKTFHCVSRGKIPRAIRKRIPELIREALQPQIEKEQENET